MRVILITGRTSSQGVYKNDKLGKKYRENVAICEICKRDLEKLGIKEGEIVKLRTKEGEICLYAKENSDVEEGTIFCPLSPWINFIIPRGTDSIGMPTFKGLEVEIEPAKESRVLKINELIEKIKGD
ncbi:MAG: tRNA CCA-pyrophosphorylase [Thermoplasmata archaeon]|nr:MAG: tRNA CCA-pyrophosphorylase [Thermoplasmata archaeon]